MKSGRLPFAFILILSLIIGVMGVIVKVIEYKHLLDPNHSHLYLALVAFMFLIVGTWMGILIVKKTSIKNVLHQADSTKVDLTKRESEVLMLIAEGYSNHEIAEKLFVSLPTVKSHTTNLYSKLNVQRRTQAIIKAKELKIL